LNTQDTALAIDTINQVEGEDKHTSQYLTFVLGNETYGVDILRVQEIKGWTPVTAIPNTPSYIKGVLNLRGTIVPVIDLRTRFNLKNVEYTALTVIIVLTIQSEYRSHVAGVVVDSVSDVLNVIPEEIEPAPDLGEDINTDFITGLATTQKQITMLLDIDRMMSLEELTAIDSGQVEKNNKNNIHKFS